MAEPERKSSRPTPPWWLLLVTVMGGAFMVQRGTQPATEKTPPSSSAPTVEGSAAASQRDRIRGPLREFLGLPVRKAAPPAIVKWEWQVSKPDVGGFKVGAEWSKTPGREMTAGVELDLQAQLEQQVGLLEFLVVTVADPIDTATNSRFDMQIDALHKVLGVEGYVPDHFYLPWNDKVPQALHRTEPGAILYRRAGASHASKNGDQKTDLLLVYLIGETPTSGIQKEAFGLAIRDISEFRGAVPKLVLGLNPIRVVGPTFTGGAESLALAIRQASNPARKFHVISGSATSVDQKRFKNLAGDHCGELYATVLNANLLRNALIEHVLEHTQGNVRIAWLTETGTSYGRSAGKTQASPTVQGRTAEIVDFRFPENIAKVRADFVESRRRERTNQSSLGHERSRLPIPFGETATGRDVLPMQTPAITTPTVELLLEQMLATIRNQEIKYVGISSSDARDPIFLAELLKEQSPDVQIMIVLSDILQAHPEYRTVMHGALVSSTNPLHPEAQEWCFPYGEENERKKSRSFVLSNQTNYGVYNAVLLQRRLESKCCTLGTDGLITLSAEDMQKALPLGYSLPFQKPSECDALRPGVWISRIGSTGIYPIAVRDPVKMGPDEAAYTLGLRVPEGSDRELTIRTRLPTSLFVVTLFWLAGGALYLIALRRPKPTGNWASPLAPCPKSSVLAMEGLATEHYLRPLIYIFRTFITCAFGFMVSLLGALIFAFVQRTSFLNWQGVLGLGCLIVCGAMAIRLGRDLRLVMEEFRRACRAARWRRQRAPRAAALPRRAPRAAAAPANPDAKADLQARLRVVHIVALALIAILGSILFSASGWQLWTWLKERPEESFLWFMVTGDIWNGISNIMAAQFLSAAVIILAYGMLQQIHLLSKRYTIGLSDPWYEKTARLRTNVRNALLFPLLSRMGRERPVVLDLFCIAGALFWIYFLWKNLENPDFFARPLSLSCTLLFFAFGFWIVRFFKLVQMLNLLSGDLKELMQLLNRPWPKGIPDWQDMFNYRPAAPYGLQGLLWSTRRDARDPALKNARDKLRGSDQDAALRKLRAIEIELYVRQFFHHIGRLGFGLVVSACLLFLTVQAFPFSHEPLLRLTASVMLAAIGCLMAWYYVKFDRNELLSRLVGTDPHQISLNWSMIQTIAPAVLLAGVALLSQAFPELWQWVRTVLEPLARS